ncbi:L,D-transpeptidase family protein [Halomonas sp. LR3S48]|uniref:L,D-transpeptidase family protein n=1 Tax=Halomonas sp. LR3S48 TaxID=2982694 RepID=UPI0021E3866C|nr:L,D-transpeptidase family protein [Halomonas sp. LR3S48]UYG04980.1 L,D-transpeptidase family protein [Halomonas sp. LR3S48]
MRVITWMGMLMLLLGLVPQAWAEQGEAARAWEDEPGVVGELARQAASEGARMQAFYALRDYRPAWQDADTVAAFTSALHTLESDGLHPRDYRPDELRNRHRAVYEDGADIEAQAQYDLFATRQLLLSLDHLQRGKVDPESLDTGWEVPVAPPDYSLEAVSSAVDQQRFEALIGEVRPDFIPYQRLRSGLARYRNIEKLGGWPRLPERERALRPGDVDEDVPLLRERLAVVGELEILIADNDIFPGGEFEAPDPRLYDASLEAAVKRFQRRHLLEADGVIGRQTLAALNVPVERRIDQIRLNMERARWLLHGLPESFVLVDIAGYRLSYYRPDGQIWRSRIVVGQPYRRTPSLRSEITHMTVNPTWTIPPTIKREDVLPRVRQDLGYLWRERIQVLSPSGAPLDPWEIDWNNPGNIVLRQAPGPQNALGQLVIRFPNDHMVYLHDTPSQSLFSREQRAFSSGCIRVENIRELGQLLFDDTRSGHDVEQRIESEETQNVRLTHRMPIIIHYWTVNPGDDGELSFRPDIYERDDALLRALDRPLSR